MLKIGTLTTLLLSGLATAQTWESAPALPTGGAAKVWAVGANLGGTIYALGGTPWSGGGDGTVYSLDLGAIGWVEELTFDGIGPVISQGGGIDSLGRIVIFGGENTDNFDPGDTFDWDMQEGPWHNLAMRSAAAPVKYFAYCSDSAGRIYSLGGGGGENGPNTAHAERYIANSDTWELIAPMPVAAGDAAAVDDGMGHILVIGGVSGDGTARLTEVQQFDTTTGTWSTTAVPDLPVGISQASAVRDVNGKIYLLGGREGPLQGTTRNEVLIYDPALGTWADGPSMTTPRRLFAAVLGSDDFIYAIGGDNDSGGTNTVEKMHPTDCPVFNNEPTGQTIWRGAKLYLHSDVVGAQPITLQWQRGGVNLVDGTSAHGSVITGATADTLVVTNTQPEDTGFYTLVASNACGTATTTPASNVVRVQVPMPTSWTITNLHPGFDHSYALSVEDGVQGGHVIFDTPEFNGIDHPTLWHGAANTFENLTPAGSQGGAINAIANGVAVGWWWRPFDCFVNHQWLTCYYRRASTWVVGTGEHRYPTASGWEYHSMSDTDGTWHVGTVTNDDDSGNVWSHAYIWTEPNFGGIDLHPTSGASSSFASAIDGADQYGSINTPYPAPSPRAAKWSGSRDSFVLMHPTGVINSSISAARDGQQVGIVNRWQSDVYYGLWSGTPESFMPFIDPAFATNSLKGVEGGYQFGTVTYPDGHSSVYLWRGAPGEGIDLGQYLDSEFTSATIADMDIEPDGTVVLVGYGYNANQQQYQALMWTGTLGTGACSEADLVEPFGVLDFFDVAAYLAQFSAGDLAADLNGDGLLDFFDVSAFLSAFSAGCP
jgi:Immunoglobulin I-set domain/Kelch motif